MITKYIIGDICETELKYIAHGVNCQNVMGSGVAKALYTKYPEVKIKYHDFCNRQLLYYNPSNLLGRAEYVFNKEHMIGIFNCFTQENFGYDGKRYVNYSAVVYCFESIIGDLTSLSDNPNLAIPKIGCGLAGGDWNFMEQLINDTVGNKLEIWVYELEEKRYSKRNDLA